MALLDQADDMLLGFYVDLGDEVVATLALCIHPRPEPLALERPGVLCGLDRRL